MKFSEALCLQKTLFFGDEKNIAHHKYLNLINYTTEASKLLTMARSEFLVAKAIENLETAIKFIEDMRKMQVVVFNREKEFLTKEQLQEFAKKNLGLKGQLITSQEILDKLKAKEKILQPKRKGAN